MHTMWLRDSKTGSYAVGMIFHHVLPDRGDRTEWVETAQVTCDHPEKSIALAAQLVSFLNGGKQVVELEMWVKVGKIKFL